MSLPYSSIVPISAVVDSPAFTTEKKHMLLAMVNNLIPTSTPAIEFSGANAVSNFGAYFGQGIPEYAQVQKYFGFLSKSGNAPEKLIVARWYKTPAAAFIKGSAVTATVSQFSNITNGSIGFNLDGVSAQVTVDLSNSGSYSDVASKLQEAMQTSFSGATVEYSSVTNGFIVSSGTSGVQSSAGGVTAGESGTDLSTLLGLNNAVVSQGANSETYAEFCDRIYHANTAGYSITTLESLTEDEITAAVQWLQGSQGNQTIYSVVRLVFNFSSLTTAKAIASSLNSMSYTGYVLTYDPNNEFVNVLDCAICATIDYETANGAINFNFQPAVGYTSVTQLGSVVDYQQGLTNSSLMNDLNSNCISAVYSVGFGSQEQIMYGFGLMAGAFGSEDIQVNESALEQDLQVSIINALVSLNKIKAQGSDAQAMVSAVIAAPLDKFKANGAIAMNGTLSNADRISIVQATGNADAADAVAQNGYYYQIQDLTAEDLANHRIRVLICYLAGGVVNQVRIINRIYGA